MPKAKKAPKGRSDVPMIRDFIEHLLWNAATNHYEVTTPNPESDNTDLQQQLVKCIKRRNTIALTPQNEMTGCDSVEVGQARRSDYEREIGEEISGCADHLNGLKEVLDEALQCAEHPDAIFRKKHDPYDITRGES